MLAGFLLASACLRDPAAPESDGPTVTADVYALGFCSLKCQRRVDCGELDDTEHATCEDTCIQDALDDFPGDPCWADWIEVRRCRVRAAECDGVADETLPATAQSECDARQATLDACDP